MFNRVYVGASRYELEETRAVQNHFREVGAHITEDWTAHVEQHGENPLRYDQKLEMAALDRRGVRTADLFCMLLYDGHAQRGTHTELGLALAYRIPTWIVYMSGPAPENYVDSVFYWDTNVRQRFPISLIEHRVKEWAIYHLGNRVPDDAYAV